MKSLNDYKKGFTLIEAIVACSIALFCISVISLVVTSSVKNYYRTQSNYDNTIHLQRIIEEMYDPLASYYGPNPVYNSPVTLEKTETVTYDNKIYEKKMIIEYPLALPSGQYNWKLQKATVVIKGPLLKNGDPDIWLTTDTTFTKIYPTFSEGSIK